MKLGGGSRKRALWHKKFAWFPVHIGGDYYIWLEYVWAKQYTNKFGEFYWLYGRID